MCWISRKDLARLEAKIEVLESEKRMYKDLYYSQNNSNRDIVRMINEFESSNTCGEAGHRAIIRIVKDELIKNMEKKFSDEIIGTTSKNQFRK